VPKPPGFRFYHTHVVPGGDLNRGTYSGLAGPLFIEPAFDPGAYDREIFLVLKEFQPSFSRGGDMPRSEAAALQVGTSPRRQQIFSAAVAS
jgi:hypothetical protein